MVVSGTHFRNDLRIAGGDVGILAGVIEHVVELPADEAVVTTADGEAGPLVFAGLGAGGPAGFLGEEVALGPFGLGIAEEGEKATSFDLSIGARGSGDVYEGGEEIDMGRDLWNVATGCERAFPADEEGDTNAPFIGASFESFLSGVEHDHGLAVFCFTKCLLGAPGASAGHAVVGHEDEDGVFFEIPLGQFLHEAAHVFIDVLDHTVEAGSLGGEAKVGEALLIGRRGDEGAVGSVGGNVGEEGFLLFLLLLHPAHRGGEEEVGAVALGFHEGAVVTDDGVKVFVARDVGAGAFVSLADPAGAVDEDFVEAAFVRLVGVLIAEVPLAEDPGGVTGFFEDLGKDGGLEGHTFAFKNGMGDAVLERMATGHEGGAGGRTGRADEEAGEAGALVVEGVEVGGFDPRMAVFTDGAVSLVVGHHEDDVGFLRGGCQSDEE